MAPPTKKDIIEVTHVDGTVYVKTWDAENLYETHVLANLPSTTLRGVPKHLGLSLPHGLSLPQVITAVEDFVLRGEVAKLAAEAAPVTSSEVADLTALVTAQAAQVDALVKLLTAQQGATQAPQVATDEVRHYCLDEVITIVSEDARGKRSNAFLTGPAGTGKSHLAESAAKALRLDFYSLSCGPETSQVEIIGFMNAHGDYVSTAFRQAFQHGGLFLIDEIDAADAGVITALNAALANSFYTFPDGATVTKHRDFVVVAAGNTWGSGPTMEYMGRGALDKASLDRFAGLEVGYDHTLEAALVAPYECGAEVMEAVHQVRHNAAQHDIRVIVSTRGLIDVASFVSKGMTLARALDLRILKELPEGQRAKVLSGVAV